MIFSTTLGYFLGIENNFFCICPKWPIKNDFFYYFRLFFGIENNFFVYAQNGLKNRFFQYFKLSVPSKKFQLKKF
ncbi:MAG: hypothetical protein J6C37_00450, partial [Roseburia sp.]|nr:hypothetical protein [Roseburia sp.]